MKILAQSGFGPSDKLIKGLESDIIGGVVFSPRYLKMDRLQEFVEELKGDDRQLLLDPEFFATKYLGHSYAKLGSLEEWSCFQSYSRSRLIAGMVIPEIIRNCITVQLEAGLTECISPNVYINSADSIDTGIALNFIINTKKVADAAGAKSVYASLIVDRDVFFNRNSYKDIMDALTGLDNPPDGYYLIVGSSSESSNRVRSDLYDPKVIAGLMYANYVLSLNGARVINGYCHLLGPLLGICGAEGAASGWHSGLRQFSLSKYSDVRSGGRTPLIRYVNIPLLSYITRNDFLDFYNILPEIASGTSLDSVYLIEEPSRTEEALQSWSALSKSCNESITGCIITDLENFTQHLDNANVLWRKIQGAGLSSGVEANVERLEAILDGIESFKKLAELA